MVTTFANRASVCLSRHLTPLLLPPKVGPAMPIATPKQFAAMLDAAQEGSYAYPAINCANLSTLNAAMKGFADNKSDGIIKNTITKS